MYQHSKFPFISKEFPSNVSYERGICPVAERMFDKELLLTNIYQSPQTKKEIDLFIDAVKKIENSKDQLKNYEA